MKSKKKMYIGLIVVLVIVLVGGYTVASESLQGKFKLNMSADKSTKQLAENTLNPTIATVNNVSTAKVDVYEDHLSPVELGSWEITFNGSIPSGEPDSLKFLIENVTGGVSVLDACFTTADLYIYDSNGDLIEKKWNDGSGKFSLESLKTVLKDGETYTYTLKGSLDADKLDGNIPLEDGATVYLAKIRADVVKPTGDMDFYSWQYNVDGADDSKFKFTGYSDSMLANGVPGSEITYHNQFDVEDSALSNGLDIASIKAKNQSLSAETETTPIYASITPILWATQSTIVLDAETVNEYYSLGTWEITLDEGTTIGSAIYQIAFSSDALDEYFDATGLRIYVYDENGIATLANGKSATSIEEQGPNGFLEPVTSKKSGFELYDGLDYSKVDTMPTQFVVELYGKPNQYTHDYFGNRPVYLNFLDIITADGEHLTMADNDQYGENKYFDKGDDGSLKGSAGISLTFL